METETEERRDGETAGIRIIVALFWFMTLTGSSHEASGDESQHVCFCSMTSREAKVCVCVCFESLHPDRLGSGCAAVFEFGRCCSSSPK